MGTQLRNKISGMSLKAKAALISLFTLLLTIGLYQGWQKTSHAAPPVAATTWKQAYANAAYPNAASVATLTPPAGTNRLLVVAIASTQTATGTALSITPFTGTTAPTVGGRLLVKAAGDETVTTTWNHTVFYYMKEADIAAMSGAALSLKITGGTSYYNYVYYRYYTDVEQSAPFTDAKNFNSGATANTTVGPYSPGLNIAVDDQGIQMINITRNTTGTTARTLTTPAAGWTVDAATDIAPVSVSTSGPTMSLYLKDRNVYTANAADGSSHIASSTVFDSMVAMSIKTVAPTTTAVNGNTPIAPAGTRLDNEAGVVMQRVALTATGSTEISSLTINDLGTANAIASVEIYISSAAQMTLPQGPPPAVLIGNVTNWAGTSTVVNLTGGTVADRTLTAAVPKYLYIVYDMSAGQASKTVQSNITGLGVVAPNTSTTGLNLSSNIVTLDYAGNTVGATIPVTGATLAKDSDAAVLMQHFKVDCNSGFDNALELASITLEDLGSASQVSAVKVYVSGSSSASTLPGDAKLIGQITEFNKASTAIPLNNDYGASALDRTVLAGTSKYIYIVYSMFYADTFTAGLTVQSKVTALGAASPDYSVAGLNFNSNIITLTRGTWSKITSCGGCHATAAITDVASRNLGGTGQFPGSHYTHTNKNGYDCTECHARPVALNHASGYINFSGNIRGGKYSRAPQDLVKVSNSVYAFGTCSQVSCHNNGAGGTKYGTETRAKVLVDTPAWGSTATCWSCHGTAGTNGAPSYVNNSIQGGAAKANSHSGTTHAAQLCTRCHNSIKGTGPYTFKQYSGHADGYYTLAAPNVGYNYVVTGGTCNATGTGCHLASTVTWGTALPCLDCHTAVALSAPNATLLDATVTTRRGISTEFTLTSKHTRSRVPNTITSNDCGVCHMEGLAADGSKNTTISPSTPGKSYHGNGLVELRNPDTGTTIVAQTWNGAANAQGTFVDKAATPAAVFVRFTRNLAVRPEAETTNYPGTTNTIFEVNSAIQNKHCLACHDSNGATNALARIPAAGTLAFKPFNATVAANGANQGVLDVASQFATTNRSYHPVLGKQNNAYAGSTRMVAPFNNVAKSGTTTVYGPLITCWDCHAANGASGTLTATTVHGGAVTGTDTVPMRGQTYTVGTTAATNYCFICHAGYTSVDSHLTGSAFATLSRTAMGGINNGCFICHGSGITSSQPARPISAGDAHGFSTRAAGTAFPATNNGYAFIRSEGFYGSTYQNLVQVGATAYTANCTGYMSGGICAGRSGMGSYTPGGKY